MLPMDRMPSPSSEWCGRVCGCGQVSLVDEAGQALCGDVGVSVGRLCDGVSFTHDDLHVWSAPFRRGDVYRIRVGWQPKPSLIGKHPYHHPNIMDTGPNHTAQLTDHLTVSSACPRMPMAVTRWTCSRR